MCLALQLEGIYLKLVLTGKDLPRSFPVKAVSYRKI
jgi:hypothetical protein